MMMSYTVTSQRCHSMTSHTMTTTMSLHDNFVIMWLNWYMLQTRF